MQVMRDCLGRKNTYHQDWFPLSFNICMAWASCLPSSIPIPAHLEFVNHLGCASFLFFLENWDTPSPSEISNWFTNGNPAGAMLGKNRGSILFWQRNILTWVPVAKEHCRIYMSVKLKGAVDPWWMSFSIHFWQKRYFV